MTANDRVTLATAQILHTSENGSLALFTGTSSGRGCRLQEGDFPMSNKKTIV
jgi:hypothetical protein